MSRGPGRIERAIRELLDAHPDLAFVTDELVEHCYGTIYKSPKRIAENNRARWFSWCHQIPDREAALRKLSTHHIYKEWMEPDGLCSQLVKRHIAYRDGDAATREALKAKGKAELDALSAAFNRAYGTDQDKCFEETARGDKETLTRDGLAALASRIRSLAMQNDPDALRSGLTEVAAELDLWAGASIDHDSTGK